jgi:hypothetical protein
VRLHHQRRERELAREREHKREVEPWYMRGVTTPVTPGGVNGGKPGWGVVGGIFPVTPAASPEPVYRNGNGGGPRFEGHVCGAERVVERLEGLARLVDGVEGLVLEGSLGYRVY